MKTRRLLMVVLVLIAAAVYAHFTFWNLDGAENIARQLEERPYVYRALVPALAHGLVLLGVPADLALTLVVMVLAIGLMYGIQYLAESFKR